MSTPCETCRIAVTTDGIEVDSSTGNIGLEAMIVHTTLAEGGVAIPDDYICEYETTSGQRAKIVVFEQTGKLKLRVCGLSLTMVATR